MSKMIGKSCVVTTVAAILGLLCVFSPLLLRADVLTGSDEGLAAMMGAAETHVAFLALQAGSPFAAPLHFTSQFTSNSFQFSLDAGSLYNGIPISLTSTGLLTAPDTWTATTSGSIGGNTWSANDVFIFGTSPVVPLGLSFHPQDSPLPPDEDWGKDNVLGSDGNTWSWRGHITWIVDPDDPGLLDSVGEVTYIKVPADPREPPSTIVVPEEDSQRRFQDDDGSWQIVQNNNFGPGGPGVAFRGGFNAAGNGAFVAQVVPEPSYTVLLASALAGLCMWRCRSFRHSRNSLAN